MSLVEIKNTLNNKNELGLLKLQNDHYIITIRYCGNYKTEYKNNTIDHSMISIGCRCLDNNIIIKYNGSAVFVDLNASVIPHIHDMLECEQFQQQLFNAVNTVIELQKIIEKYFDAVKFN